MLIMLLGFGNGLQNGVKQEFERDAVNSIWVNSGKTSVPYKGMAPGRRIRFTNKDYDMLKSNIGGVQNVTTRNYIWSVSNISYKNESSTFDIMACHPGYRYLENAEMTGGRFLNDNDVAETRKVVVLGNLVVAQLFKEEDPVGKYISVNGIPFRVVGTFQDQGGERDQRRLYIPISTGQRVFDQVNYVQQISMTTSFTDLETSEMKSAEIRNLLSEQHQIAPTDPSAIRIHNNMEEYKQFTDLFFYIEIFVWFVGILTIIAGIVGVGNIMMISVKERTKEIGIRKALGATPFSIVNLIMQEAVAITLFSGYFGLIMGVGLLELLGYGVKEFNIELGFFRDPGVDFGTAITATIILVFAGSLAGLIPSVKAARINPIVAIREE